MKICIVTQNLYTLGGIQRVVTTLLNELAKDIGYDITVLMPFTMSGPKLFSVSEEIGLHNIEALSADKSRTWGRWILAVNKRTGFLDNPWGMNLVKKLVFQEKELDRFADYFNKNQYDIIIGTGPVYSCLLGELSGRITAKTVGWQHSTFDSYFLTRGKSNYGMRQYAKQCSRKLDAVWVLTKTDKRKFDREFNIESQVFYNPIAVRKVIYTPEKDSILFVGRLVTGDKGLDFLIEIMKEIRMKIPDVCLTVVGDGPDKKWFEKAVIQKGLEKHIRVVGSTDNVFQYYQKAALLAQTSRFEGFGMTIVEAMSCGVPAVAFHNCGPDEIIRDGTDGYLIAQYDIGDFAGKAVYLLRNHQIWRSFSENAVRRAEDFSLMKLLPVFQENMAAVVKSKI